MKESAILTKSFDFGLRIIKLSDLLVERRAFVLADQVLRSGTGIGANAEEATAAVSRKEFISKNAIAYKEARETRYWLRLLRESNKIDRKLADSFIKECEELCKILSSIIKSTRKNDEPLS